ncbi:MAG: tetratricopeptide repeat protein, partial [Hyphococcus sp.]
ASEIVRPSFDVSPLALRNSDQKKWHARVPGERAWYVKIDEIEAFPDYHLSDFMADALRAARRARAEKLLLDIRDNHGGSASFNAAVVNALSQSEYNKYGRLFVLTGRETFSAASMLMSSLERYTNAVFVGEPSGARPSHFGDPKKIQLPNSGLTLRVSTLAWRSWLAGDFRAYIETHIDAPPTATAYFAGRDPAIEAALAYAPPANAAAEMAELFDKNKIQAGVVRFLAWLNAPVDGTHDAVADLLAIGHHYLDAGELRLGRFMMVMARDYYPANADARAGLGRALELNGDAESARRRYEEALEIDSNNDAAKRGLARLAGEDA